MKIKILSLLFVALFSTSLFAQQQITNEEHERILTHVEDNLYNVQFLNSTNEIVQEGQYWKENETLKPHGTWTLYSMTSGDIVTTSTFDKGERISVETIVDGKIVKADKQQLSILKIEKEIDRLEKRLADLKEN
jgi:predicted 2-oxoglutarate/Fe(II)-dependent dioxygenase YbiX